MGSGVSAGIPEFIAGFPPAPDALRIRRYVSVVPRP